MSKFASSPDNATRGLLNTIRHGGDYEAMTAFGWLLEPLQPAFERWAAAAGARGMDIDEVCADARLRLWILLRKGVGHDGAPVENVESVASTIVGNIARDYHCGLRRDPLVRAFPPEQPAEPASVQATHSAAGNDSRGRVNVSEAAQSKSDDADSWWDLPSDQRPAVTELKPCIESFARLADAPPAKPRGGKGRDVLNVRRQHGKAARPVSLDRLDWLERWAPEQSVGTDNDGEVPARPGGLTTTSHPLDATHDATAESDEVSKFQLLGRFLLALADEPKPRAVSATHLHFLQGLCLECIALELGVPKGTVKSDISRVRARAFKAIGWSCVFVAGPHRVRCPRCYFSKRKARLERAVGRRTPQP